MEMNKITIEVLKETDINEYSALINEVMNEFNKEEVDNFQIWFASVKGINIRRSHNAFHKYATLQFAAKYDGKIIGALEIEDAIRIQSFFVRKEFQKQGVGRKLLSFSMKYFINNGVKLFGYYVSSSMFAVNFYKKLGFTGDNTNLYLRINHKYTEKIIIIYKLILRRLGAFIRDTRAYGMQFVPQNIRTADAYYEYLDGK
jgi:ribosomal protein S18 acetylase RimI-like enzyme